ncbi:MAG: hypothetical protein JNL17_15660 [Cyclobacteriaceae bacterium]|nr:hypothetical protein [Cyclobacteriaceae bacterium]
MEAEDIGLYLAYTVLIVAVAAAIVLPLLNALKHPKTLIGSLMGIGALVVLFVICYAISDSSVSPTARALGIDESSSKLIGAGLYTFYAVFIVSIVGMVYSEVNKALK